MVEDMVTFLLKLRNPSLEKALCEFYPDAVSTVDLFNIDLPHKANIELLIDTLENLLKKVELRKHTVTLAGQARAGKLLSINMPLWDMRLLYD
jgi:hypothetical protein